MEIKITGSSKEIAGFVAEIQSRLTNQLQSERALDSMSDIIMGKIMDDSNHLYEEENA